MLEGAIELSINIRSLIAVDLKSWVSSKVEAPEGIAVAEGFWVVPISEEDPEFPELVENGIKVISSTKVIGQILHDSLQYVLLEDYSGKKLFIAHLSGYLPDFELDQVGAEFLAGDLHFLQYVYLVTKFNISTTSKIPHALVSTLPIFEDDILPFFPKKYIFELAGAAKFDNMWVLCIKASLLLERDCTFITDFGDEIVALSLAIPAEGHDWIFEQLATAIKSGRLISFYLEIYKIFEFFFPLESIFKLADRLEFFSSELELLEHCRGALSWNVNHQRGARSALAYATVSFAEICLDEAYTAECSELSFKERAMDKMTAARHSLTHQDFKSVAVSDEELKKLGRGLLVFLQDAFEEYSLRRKARGDRRAEYLLRKHAQGNLVSSSS